MKKFAIIVAGGQGKRMNSDLPKQFILILGKPVLYYTLRTFLDSYDDLEVILVLPENSVAQGKEIIDAWFDKRRIKVVPGGETRFHSVKNGLAQVENDSIVFVHDGVRCLVSTQLLHRCYQACLEFGTAIPVIEPKDSLRKLTNTGSESVDRNLYRIVQTPQTFHATLLLNAMHQIDYKERFTDEASVVESFGIQLHLVEGETSNLKITTPDDIMIATQILKEQMALQEQKH